MRHLTIVRRFASIGMIITMAFAARAAWAAKAGTVEFALGNVTATDTAGASRTLVKHGEVRSGDRIVTGQGRAQIRFTDGAYVSLIPDTEFLVRSYAYEGRRDGSESSLLALFKGTIRAVSGAIARSGSDKFQITTPTATLGVRGTGGIITVHADGSTQLTATSGVWVMTNPVGTITVPAGGSAIVTPVPTDAPRRTAAQAQHAPSPQARAGGAQQQQSGSQQQSNGQQQNSGQHQANGQQRTGEPTERHHAANGPQAESGPGARADAGAPAGDRPHGEPAGQPQSGTQAHAPVSPVTVAEQHVANATNAPAQADSGNNSLHSHMLATATGTATATTTAPPPVLAVPLSVATTDSTQVTSPVTPAPTTTLPPATAVPAPLPPMPFDAITLVESPTEVAYANLKNVSLGLGALNDLQNIQVAVSGLPNPVAFHATTTPGTAVTEVGNLGADLYWGRWTGTFNAMVNGTFRPVTLMPNDGYHYLVGLPTAPNTFPTSGVATYTFAGATNPTISTGTIAPGSFDTTSTMRIDFATGKVGVDMKMTWGPALVGQPNAMVVQVTTPTNLMQSPISLVPAVSGSGFQPRFTGTLNNLNAAGSGATQFIMNAPATLNLNCVSTCTGGLQGIVAGPGGVAAGFGYKLGNTGSNTAITGVAGFQKQ